MQFQRYARGQRDTQTDMLIAILNLQIKKSININKSVGLYYTRHSSSPRLSLLSLLTNTLPGPSASEVTTLWRYTNLFIIIINVYIV